MLSLKIVYFTTISLPEVWRNVADAFTDHKVCC